MKEHNGENPQNARIKINYSGKKPKVGFSYPVNKKDSRTTGDMFFPIVVGWLFIMVFVMIGFEGADVLDLTYDKTELQIFAECVANNPTETLNNYSNIRDGICDLEDLFEPTKLLFLVMLFTIPPILIYYPFKKKWNKLYPDYEALIARKKYKKFKDKDLIKGKEGEYYLELPVFNNVVCDFNATKDFSRYMNEFEIEEYKFEYNKKRKMKSNKKKAKPKNEFIWYARWYFKKKPTKGFLEVTYK